MRSPPHHLPRTFKPFLMIHTIRVHHEWVHFHAEPENELGHCRRKEKNIYITKLVKLCEKFFYGFLSNTIEVLFSLKELKDYAKPNG